MAFPSQPVLDAFNRADGGLGASWTSPVVSGEEIMEILSNQVKKDTGNAPRGSDYWNGSTHSEAEAYADLPTLPSVNAYVTLTARIVNPGGASLDGYEVRITDRTDAARMRWSFYRIDDGVFTLVGGNTDDILTPSSYQIGLEASGSTFTFYRTNGGGAWTNIGTRSDATYSAAGYIGLGASGGAAEAARLDNFGGGTIGAGAAYQPRYGYVHHNNPGIA